MSKLIQIRRVLITTLLLNLGVSAIKLVTGYAISSNAMIADGFHSMFDASSNVIGLIGMRVAHIPPDASHPYGHKKYETFAALGVALMLFLTCFEVLERAIRSLLWGGVPPVEASYAGFGVMLISITVNVFVTRYESKKGREYQSDFLLADAAHTKSDILASASVIASLLAARLGFPGADAVAAVIIAVLIFRVGFDIVKRSSNILCDAAIIDPDELVRLCMSVEGVIRCHDVRNRGREDAISVDLCIHVDPRLSITESHKIGHRVEEVIKSNMPGVVDVVVHIEPHEVIDLGRCRPRP